MMLYLYFETEQLADGQELHRLCLDSVEMGDDPFVIGGTTDVAAANAKGQQLANLLRAGGADVSWWPLA